MSTTSEYRNSSRPNAHSSLRLLLRNRRLSYPLSQYPKSRLDRLRAPIPYHTHTTHRHKPRLANMPHTHNAGHINITSIHLSCTHGRALNEAHLHINVVFVTIVIYTTRSLARPFFFPLASTLRNWQYTIIQHYHIFVHLSTTQLITVTNRATRPHHGLTPSHSSLGGSAGLTPISFPGLPKLLSSATHLVELYLHNESLHPPSSTRSLLPAVHNVLQ
jgi:hypothetical protein